MDYEKEIPFGAFDSELMHEEINIPEGFEAEIKGNKIILKKIESEDERIRKVLVELVKCNERSGHFLINNVTTSSMLAWLEKQDPKKHEEELEKAYKTADKVQYRRGYEAAMKEMEKQNEQKATIEMVTPEESLGIDSETYNKIVDECIYGDDKQKPTDKVESFDKYEGLTDFERTLADICIGWTGEEIGWKQYIKDNADVLLKIAFEKFNSVQDVPFDWSEMMKFI